MPGFLKDTSYKQVANDSAWGNVPYLRWLFILFVFPAQYWVAKSTFSSLTFVLTFVVAVIYNSIATAVMLRSNKQRPKLPAILLYTDILLVCTFVLISGGIHSEAYILFFFVVCFYGIGTGIRHTVIMGLFAVLAYSVICILHGMSEGFGSGYITLFVRDLLIFLAACWSSVISLKFQQYDEIQRKNLKLARTDKLTGLPNRHHLEQKLPEEVAYADQTGNPLNVLIFDLDDFKVFNDSYGHVWGDKLLSLFADILRQGIRKGDIPVRYGGEEFLILIRDLDLSVVKKVGDRIRTQLEKQRLYIGNDEPNKKRVTVSCGIAQYPFHSKSIREVIELADKALYQAKDSGKNTVIVYDRSSNQENSSVG